MSAHLLQIKGLRHDYADSKNVARMSSLEIAQLTGKAHRNVLRDVRDMLLELHGKEGVLSFEHTHINGQNGQRYPCFLLPRREVEILLTGYSIALRAKVIDRLRELEDGQPPAIPKTLPEALRLAADLAEQNNRLQLVVMEQAPKVEALERLADSQGVMCITDAAKHLGIQRKRLIDWLLVNRWVYRRSGSALLLGYEPRLRAGLLVHKVTVIGLDDDGGQRLASQVRVTAKGLALLAQKIGGAR